MRAQNLTKTVRICVYRICCFLMYLNISLFIRNSTPKFFKLLKTEYSAKKMSKGIVVFSFYCHCIQPSRYFTFAVGATNLSRRRCTDKYILLCVMQISTLSLLLCRNEINSSNLCSGQRTKSVFNVSHTTLLAHQRDSHQKFS